MIKEREDNHENVCDDHDQSVDPDRSGGPMSRGELLAAIRLTDITVESMRLDRSEHHGLDCRGWRQAVYAGREP